MNDRKYYIAMLPQTSEDLSYYLNFFAFEGYRLHQEVTLIDTDEGRRFFIVLYDATFKEGE